MALLSLESVSASYGAGKPVAGRDRRSLLAGGGGVNVLHEISLTVEPDEIVTLIGANGAGKSTTLLAISGLVGKTSGRILFDGRDITRLPAHKIVSLGVIHVPEGRGIFPRLTVEENLLMGAFSKGRPDTAVQEQALELFPILRERLRQAGGTLSGGEQQMLAIARGLMAKPRLLILDEPSLGVAPLLADKIFAALLEIHRAGTPMLLVEQNAMKALSISNRAYVMETGRIVLADYHTGGGVAPEVLSAYLGMD